MRKINPAPARPTTLEEGSFYYLRRRTKNYGAQSWKEVRFVSYTPCPAVVIVDTGAGERIPIAREELFTG